MVYFLTAWFFTHFAPLQDYLTLIKMPAWLFEALTCWKCLTFWLILICTLNIQLALIYSLIAWFLTEMTSQRLNN